MKRKLLIAMVSLWCCVPAWAQEVRSLAVLSLVADSISVVIPQMVTGSHMDRNLRQTVKLPDDSLEIAAVQAAEAAVKQLAPDTALELFVTQDPRIYGVQAEESVHGDAVPALLNTLKPVLAQTKATHLLLITKHRADAAFQLADGKTGVGKLFGVGLYQDEGKRLINVDTGDFKRGFIGPFAVLKVQLIDLRTRSAVKEANAQASEVHSGPTDKTSAWEAMSAAKKTQALQRVIQEAVTDGVERVLKQPS